VHEQVRNKRLTLEQAGIHPMRNSLLRSVGVAPEVEIDVERVDVQPGDRFLLCSDGLWGEVDAGGIARALDGDEPEEAARKLVELANQNGGADNITVQIARVAGAPAERKGRLRRWLGRLSGS
jgi:serine/threonine protein phosphatase PrpC